MTAKDIVQKLKLKPHPEGGFYKETYRADHTINSENGLRNVCTAIYFLLDNNARSLFHRIKSDELWFFHLGEPLEIVLIQDEKLTTITLGSSIENEQSLQAIIPANTWFAAKVKTSKGFSLVSCTVSPGFNFTDFELAKRDELLQQFPALKKTIEDFT